MNDKKLFTMFICRILVDGYSNEKYGDGANQLYPGI